MSERNEEKAGPAPFSLLPRLAIFLYHLARDPRVPWTVKAAVVGMAAYLAIPLDLLPDWIPGAGQIDDLLLVAIVINYVFAKIPEEVLIEHWGEDVERLRGLRREQRQKAA